MVPENVQKGFEKASEKTFKELDERPSSEQVNLLHVMSGSW